jgi:hypothetical protein
LITGYKNTGAGIISLQKGNVEAFAPKEPTVYDRAAKGELPPSFTDEVQTFQVPESPDFMQVGDFNEDGRKDLLTAARGGGLYLLDGDGVGGFSAPERIQLPGTVTALTEGQFAYSEGLRAVIAGVIGPDGPALAVLNHDSTDGLSRDASVCPLPGSATALALGIFDDDPYPDLAVAALNQILIFHGEKPAENDRGNKRKSLLSRIERIDLGFNIVGLAAGTFAPDGVPRMDLAALASDGTIHILQRSTKKSAAPFDASVELAGLSGYEQKLELRKRTLEAYKASTRVPAWQPDAKQNWAEVRQLETRISLAAANAAGVFKAGQCFLHGRRGLVGDRCCPTAGRRTRQ